MSIKKTVCRLGVVLAVAGAVGLLGCEKGDNGVTPPPPATPYNFDPVSINGLTWTKNLNIETPDSWCYDDDPANCEIYGRLYTWEAAKSVCASMGGSWRLPASEDWDNLVNSVGGAATAGKKLKAKSGWNDNGNGDDEYGFSALPGGARFPDGRVVNVGYHGSWWSATELGTSNAHDRRMRNGYDDVDEHGNPKGDAYSVRCVTD